VNHLATLLLTLAAFGCLACATDRPQRQLFSEELAAHTTQRLRWSGGLLLLSALAVSLATDTWALGLVAWVGHTSAGAALVYLALLGWARRRAQPS
jgi:hypothetical protein